MWVCVHIRVLVWCITYIIRSHMAWLVGWELGEARIPVRSLEVQRLQLLHEYTRLKLKL
jgi:hypothetical protein